LSVDVRAWVNGSWLNDEIVRELANSSLERGNEERASLD